MIIDKDSQVLHEHRNNAEHVRISRTPHNAIHVQIDNIGDGYEVDLEPDHCEILKIILQTEPLK
jgi:hypothetical protein